MKYEIIHSAFLAFYNAWHERNPYDDDFLIFDLETFFQAGMEASIDILRQHLDQVFTV